MGWLEISEAQTSYLICDTLTDRAFTLFSSRIASGANGICVTRTHPQELIDRYDMQIPFIWLTKQSHESFDTTNELNELKSKILTFLEKNERPLILLDRIDYLVMMHGFSDVLKFIYELNDAIQSGKAEVFIAVNPSTLNSRELSLLQQELEELPKLHHAEHNISDDLHEILAYVNNNEKVSFKMVSKEFSITKTTTRKRINNLLSQKFVSVSKNGRNKLIRLTESGARML